MLIRIIIFLSLLLSSFVHAASGHDVHLDHVEIDLTDKASLQRGAKTFINYCMGCHSAELHRYERAAKDLGIPPELFKKHLLFTHGEQGNGQIGDLMEIAMKKEDAEKWFGVAPPDLSLMTRLKGPGSRGPDYVYTFLRSFYIDGDEARPWGVNNVVFPNTAMPHVLLDLQGEQRKVCAQVPVEAENGGVKRDPETGKDITEENCDVIELTPNTGKLSVKEYDLMVKDLVNFMTYVGDPSRVERHRIGVYVLLFLALLFVFAYLLKREYWKDVH